MKTMVEEPIGWKLSQRDAKTVRMRYGVDLKEGLVDAN